MGKNVKDINVVLENIHPLTLESVFVDYKSTLNKKACFYLKPPPIIIQKQIFQKPAYFKLWFFGVLFRGIYSWILKKNFDDTWYLNFECPWENFGSLILKLPSWFNMILEQMFAALTTISEQLATEFANQ